MAVESSNGDASSVVVTRTKTASVAATTTNLITHLTTIETPNATTVIITRNTSAITDEASGGAIKAKTAAPATTTSHATDHKLQTESHHISTGAIAGLTIGIVLTTFLLVAVVFLCLRNRQRKPSRDSDMSFACTSGKPGLSSTAPTTFLVTKTESEASMQYLAYPSEPEPALMYPSPRLNPGSRRETLAVFAISRIFSDVEEYKRAASPFHEVESAKYNPFRGLSGT